MIDNITLLARINSHADGAIGGDNSDIANDRADAMDHYLGRPYGDEMEGRSHFVSRDLMEVVDWAMPELMDVMLASGNIVEFIPNGPEDEQLAQQQSDYCNYVIMRENNGWMVLHDCIKDSLILKNGYGEVYYDEFHEITVNDYEGLSGDELASFLIQKGDNIEVIEQESVKSTVDTEFGPQEVETFNVRVKEKKKRYKICVESIPTEEMRISARCTGDINDSDYIERRTTRYASDLVSAGLKKDFVDSLPGTNPNANTKESNSRDTTSAESNEMSISDMSMREIEYRVVYIKTDADEDGIAELRRVVIVGNQIPTSEDIREGKETDWNREVDQVGIFCFTPKRMPHRHVGESLDDDIKDLQEIQTVLKRNFLDNVYGLVNQEWLVNERVNLDDFLVSRPMGVKRVQGEMPVDGSARAVEKPNVLNHVLPAIQMMDETRSKRTGIRPEINGISPDELQNIKKGVYMQNLREANSKLQFMARMLAETGVKDMVLKVNGLVMKYITEPQFVRLRGKYVNVNPASWKERHDMTVNVGLGTGRLDEKRENAMMIQGAMEKLAPFGLVAEQHAYNAFYDFADVLGFANPNRYVFDPASNEYKQYRQMMMQQKQNQPNPLAEAEKVKADAMKEVETVKGQIRMMEKQAELQLKEKEITMNAAIERLKDENKRAIAIMQEEVKALIAGFNADIGKKGLAGEMRG